MSEHEPIHATNVVLTFMDEHGQEWIAGALVSALTRRGAGNAEQTLSLEALKDRAFSLKAFHIVGGG